MAITDKFGRPLPPAAGSEIETLLGFLDFHRATLLWKTAGLEAEDLAKRLLPSTMTLGGLLKHMAYVEETWFSVRLLGHEEAEPWRSVDWDSDPDWEWNSAKLDSPDDLRTLFEASVVASRELTERALGQGGLDQLAAKPRRTGEHPSLRWILVHMIEEYARHNGHADLLREAIDGSTGV